MSGIESHKRVNDIWLGPLERPALSFFARHMPSWVTPDMLTLLGIFGAVMIFCGYIFSNYNRGFLWLASFGFFINWYGDSLDGSVARYRKIQRPRYGYFVDHIVDSFNELLIIIGLGLSPYMQFNIALLISVSYLLLSVLVFLRTAVKGEFVISYGGFGPTEIRVVAIIANTILFFFGNPLVNLFGKPITIMDLGGIAIALILFVIYPGSSINQVRELAKIEPPPNRKHNS